MKSAIAIVGALSVLSLVLVLGSPEAAKAWLWPALGLWVPVILNLWDKSPAFPCEEIEN